MGSVYLYKIMNPNFDFLGYITAIVNVQDKHDRSAPSGYHWKILKCRMLIFSNSSILACPDKIDTNQVHIIFNKVGDDYDKLISFFGKFSLIQDGTIKKVNPELFQMCFQYTLLAKLAPVYNTIGYNYLIKNRCFLVSKGPQEGFKFKIWSNVAPLPTPSGIKPTTTTLEIQPVKITLIRPNNVYNPGEWVRVLPSLNKAIVEDYYEHLPENGSFRCYKDLRRHWKNIHGYRLPEEECPYYAVKFWRGEPLTYPKICIVQNYPIITPISNASEKTELMKFVYCVKQRVPQILGTPLKIRGNDNNFYETVSQEKSPETQLLSLCTPTQYLQPKLSRSNDE